MKITRPNRTRAWGLALGIGAALLATWVIAHATRSLGPQTPQVPLFNSDSAIPVLMANAPRWRFADIYFWGQDRFGAWPFLIARAVHALAETAITPERLHLGLCLWLLLGALALDRLVPKARGLAAGVYVATILAFPTLRSILFDLMQVYPWQLPSVLLAWWALRASASATRVSAGPMRRFVWPCVCAALAIWSSTVSAPLLWLLVAIEALRLRALDRQAPVRRFALGGGLAVLLPAVVEAVLRGAYHRYSLRWFHDAYATGLRLDVGHFGENTRAIGRRLIESRLLGLVCLGVLGGALATTYLIRVVRRGSPGEPSRADHASLIAGLAWMAVSQMPLLIAVEHVRLNSHQMRYLTPLLMFGSLAAGMSLVTPLVFAPELVRGHAALVVGVLACLVGVAMLPPPSIESRYEDERATAQALAKLTPGAPLLGGYWHTYIFAALAPPGQLVPMPRETEYRRTVWLEDQLPLHAQVLVAHNAFPEAGAGDHPERWIRQFGTWLELDRAAVLRGAGREFSLYRVERSPLQQLGPDAVASINLCKAGDVATLRFAPQTQAEVLVALTRPKRGVPTEAEPILAVTPLSKGDAPGPAVSLRAIDRLRSASISGSDGLSGVRLSVVKPARPGAGCAPEAIAVFGPAPRAGLSGPSAP